MTRGGMRRDWGGGGGGAGSRRGALRELSRRQVRGDRGGKNGERGWPVSSAPRRGRKDAQVQSPLGIPKARSRRDREIPPGERMLPLRDSSFTAEHGERDDAGKKQGWVGTGGRD